jgi:hypothetical protein
VDLVQTSQKHLPESKPRWMPYSIENAAWNAFLTDRMSFIDLRYRAIGEQVVHIK